MGLRLSKESREVEISTYTTLRSRPVRPGTELSAKRTFDVIVASAILLFTAPLILAVAIIVRLQDGAPALFRQSRLGKDGVPFKCYKLRSMVADADIRLQELLAADPEARREWADTQKLTHDPRITPFGHFLRKSSIDELPQLINVIRGDMSLVGPRPIVESEVSKYGDNFKDYCAVRPGLTGLWQVRGRSDTTYETRVEMDVEYVREHSFLSDLKILFLTVPAVFNSRGAR